MLRLPTYFRANVCGWERSFCRITFMWLQYASSFGSSSSNKMESKLIDHTVWILQNFNGFAHFYQHFFRPKLLFRAHRMRWALIETVKSDGWLSKWNNLFGQRQNQYKINNYMANHFEKQRKTDNKCQNYVLISPFLIIKIIYHAKYIGEHACNNNLP